MPYFGLKGAAKRARVQELPDQIEMGKALSTATQRNCFGGQKRSYRPRPGRQTPPDHLRRGHIRPDPLVADGIRNCC
jgi:peptide/nickel transport system ATP-binding protein